MTCDDVAVAEGIKQRHSSTFQGPLPSQPWKVMDDVGEKRDSAFFIPENLAEINQIFRREPPEAQRWGRAGRDAPGQTCRPEEHS